MLRNSAYSGTMTYQGIEVPCPPIVSQAMWDNAGDLLTKKTIRAARGSTKVNYLLQGLVRCEGCGRVLSARTRRERGRVLRGITDAASLLQVMPPQVHTSRPTTWKQRCGAISRMC